SARKRPTSPIKSRTTPIRSDGDRRSSESGMGVAIPSLNHIFALLTPPPPGNLPRLLTVLLCAEPKRLIFLGLTLKGRHYTAVCERRILWRRKIARNCSHAHIPRWDRSALQRFSPIWAHLAHCASST